MSKSSPITNRIQKALYMRSALKQSDELDAQEAENQKKISRVLDRRGDTETIANAETTTVNLPDKVTEVNETLQGSYTGDDEYKGDYYAPDSPLGKEMAKLGITDTSPKAIRNYEQSKLIKNRQTGNTDQFGAVTATGEDGTSREISDADLQNISDEDIKSRTSVSTTTEPGGTETKTDIKQIPSQSRRLSQYNVGMLHRGRRKALNTEFREKNKLGYWDGVNPATGKKWTKKEKKADTDVGKQILDGNYEIAENFNQDKVDSIQKREFTKSNDKSLVKGKGAPIIDSPKVDADGNPIVDEPKVDADGNPIEMREASPVKFLRGILKSTAKYTGKTVKGVGDTASKVQKSYSKGIDSAVDYGKSVVKDTKAAYKEGAGIKVDAPKVETPTKKPFMTAAEWRAKGGAKGSKSKYGEVGSIKGYKKAKADYGATTGSKSKKVTKGDPDLKGTGMEAGGGGIKPTKTTGTSWRPFGIKKRYSIPLAGAGYGVYKYTKAGDTPVEDEDITPTPPKLDDDDKPSPPPKVDPVPTTTTTTTTTPTKVDNMGLGEIDGGSGVVTGRDYDQDKKIKGPGDALSTSMRRFNERQQKKKDRAAGKQTRKDTNLASRQKRRADRRANPTLVGGALRKTFGGKKHDTSINNMGDVAKYNQKNKKKKGNASNWGSTYNA